MRGKGRLVHGALETLTHTTQQVTTHSSEPHPQASGVVPSSHTMRWLLAVSCLSLSRAVPIPTSPITPPTAVPRAACEALLSPPLVASVKAPVQAAYSECWTFQCVGTVEVTFRNMRSGSDESRVTLQNSDGYELTSLLDDRERYIATYPANGEMMVVFNDTKGDSYYEASVFTFEWECNTGPAVVPAAGFDASTYLTLPPVGSYERMYSEQAIYSWLIPCTGMLDIAAASIFRGYSATFQFINNQGAILHTGEGSFSFNKKFNVAGNFIIALRVLYSDPPDSEFTLAWSCGGTRPDLPSHDLTLAPETRAPPTLIPLSPCQSLSSPPLVASVKAPIRAAYSECWTFQCVGTVEVTFRNMSSISDESGVTLQNSDGYVLTSLLDDRERYIATYPANGEMMVVANDTWGESYYGARNFTFEWECNTGPAVVPAAGFDASTYLTLPPTGTYERMYSEQSSVNWIIPCTGMLDIAASSILRGYSATFQFINNQGAILHTGEGSFSFNKNFNVADNFIIALRVLYSDPPDSEFTLAWSCGGATGAPDTATPTSLPTGVSLLPNTTAPTLAPHQHFRQSPPQTFLLVLLMLQCPPHLTQHFRQQHLHLHLTQQYPQTFLMVLLMFLVPLHLTQHFRQPHPHLHLTQPPPQTFLMVLLMLLVPLHLTQHFRQPPQQTCLLVPLLHRQLLL